MILLILISIPLLNGRTWFDEVTSYEKSGEELSLMAEKGEFSSYDKYFIEKSIDLPSMLVFFEI